MTEEEAKEHIRELQARSQEVEAKAYWVWLVICLCGAIVVLVGMVAGLAKFIQAMP